MPDNPFPIPIEPPAPTCPPVPLTVCGNPKGYAITLEQHPDAIGARMFLRLECGQRVEPSGAFPVLEPCARVIAHNERGGISSVESELASTSTCLPVPEVPGGTMLAAGLVFLAILQRKRRA